MKRIAGVTTLVVVLACVVVALLVRPRLSPESLAITAGPDSPQNTETATVRPHAGSGGVPAGSTRSVPATKTRIFVRDSAGAPISQVRIVLIRDGAEDAIGATGEDGVLTCALNAERGDRIVTHANGFAERSIAIDAPSDQQIEITLVADASISGVVLDAEENRVGSGVYVLAFPYGADPPSLNDVSDAMRGADPTQPWSITTVVEGEFTISGLEQGGFYALLCGGAGQMGRIPGAAKTGATDVTLVVYPTYAGRLNIVTADGAEVQLSNTHKNGGDFKNWSAFDLEGARVRPVAGVPSAAILAGLDTSEHDHGFGSRLLLFCADVQIPRLGPNMFEVRYNGYEPQTVEYWAAPINEEIPEATVTLVETAEGWGELELAFVAGPVLEDTTSFPDGALHLRSESKHLVFFVPASTSPSSVLTAIPAGQYSVSFKATHGRFTYPPKNAEAMEVTVVDGQQTTVVVDLAYTGAIECLFVDAEGLPYVGPTRGFTARGNPSLNLEGKWRLEGINFFQFRHSPFVITGLLPGDYLVRVDYPIANYSSSSPGALVRVTSGEVLRLVIDLSKHREPNVAAHF